jgi:Flp pilus assembly pilin Flp
MRSLISLYSRIAGSRRDGCRGQTMTEYVLILAAVSVAGYTAFQGLETGIAGVITRVTASMAGA